jgi:hypothetical protein
MNPRLPWTNLANAALYQAGWFACVLGASAGRPWLGTFLGSGLVCTHLVLSDERGREGRLLAFALILGFLVDTAHQRTGALVFSAGSIHPDYAPPWILILWVQFASTLRYCLHWLRDRFVLGAILGSCAGAAAYAAGVRLGAAQFGPDLARSVLQIAVSWGVAVPFMLFILDRIEPSGVPGRYRAF